MKRRSSIAAGLGFVVGLASLAGVSRAGAADLDYYRDIYPFLKANCISCHNKTTTKAGLNMETPELMIKGGDGGPSIVPGKSVDSLLVEASAHSDYIEMPPDKNKTGARDLTGAELAKLKQWIDEGAKSSKQAIRQVVWQALAAEVDPIYTVAMTDEGRFVACGRGNRIFLYDLASRKLVTRVGEGKDSESAHRSLVHSLAFSPDGTRLASGSFREVKLWKKERKPASSRPANLALGSVVAVPSSDGKQIIAADKNRTLIVLDAATGKVIRKIETAAPGAVQHLAVSPDGKKAAVFAAGWNLSLWNLADGKRIAVQTTPDPALDAKHAAAQAKQAAVIKTTAAAETDLKKATAAKTAAAAALEKQKGELGTTPDEAGKKQIANAQAALAAATKQEIASKTQFDVASKATDAAKKAVDAATASLAAARKAAVNALAWSADGKSLITAGDDKLLRVWIVPAPGAAFPAPKNLPGATAAITCLAAGPSGKITSGGADNKVRIWNLADGKVAKEFSAAVINLAFSPDGKRIASGTDDGRVRLWDTASGEQLFDLRGSTEFVAKIAELQQTIDREKLEQAFQNARVAKIGARDTGLADLLAKAKDAVVAMNKKLPDAEKAIAPAKEARGAAEKKVADAEAALKTPPEGKSETALASELKAAKVAFLAAETKEIDAVSAFEAFKSNITDAEAEQKRITDTQAENTKQVAEAKATAAEAGKRQATATTALTAAKKEAAAVGPKPLALAFSADSTRIAACGVDGSIRIWAVATGSPVEETIGAATTSAALAAKSDDSFISCHPNGAVHFSASAPSWKLERVLGGESQPELFADRVNAIAFSPDGKTFATGSGEPSRSGDLTLFDVATGKTSATWKERHTDSVISLDFSPDGKLIASGAADKIAHVTEVATGKAVKLFEGHTHYVNDVAFRSDGRVLATAGADGVVNSWDMILGERKKKIEGWTKEVTSLQFIGATDRIVTSAGDNLVRIVTDAGSQVRSISKLPDFMQAAASTPDGKIIVGGGEDSFLRVWNGDDGKEIIAFGLK